MFEYLYKVTLCPAQIEAEDCDKLQDLGWTDDAIYDAVMVCSLFSFYNRWIDASGVHALSEEAHRMGGKRSAQFGYSRTPLNE